MATPSRSSMSSTSAGVATITLNDPETRNALSAGAARRADRALRARPRRGWRALRRARLLARARLLLRREPRRLRGRDAAGAQALRLRALRRAVQADRRLGQADDLRGRAGTCSPGALGIALGVRSDRRLRAGDLRHAGDQRRRLPVHDHGADLPQRPTQEGERAAAAGRALERPAGARGGHRQQGRPRRGARRSGRRVGRASSPASRR